MNPTPDPSEIEAAEDPHLLQAAKEYLAALEAGPRPDRAAFVARFPGLAEPLAPYLDALDLVHSAAPPTPAPPAAADAPAPQALGDYHIVREIGRGGMGVVYEAVQLSLGRRVALKVLPFAAALDGRQLQRFKNEAQAAAQLHHTNIVPVYAIGCERGTHYYAMQLIEGQNLADLIHHVRAANEANAGRTPDLEFTRSYKGTKLDGAAFPPEAPKPSGDSGPSPVHGPAAEWTTQHSTRSARFYRTAVQIMAQAADALDHAHQFDIIHRDIKPANLIVDERGNVWVTDFGLAQFQTSQGLTRTGDMMGTLRYMSPEQAGGNHALIDARADIYSLGATFYELLTLRPMFDGADTSRLLRQILHDEPRPPRSVDRSIPLELQTIVLKAVAKNPADRYATAREFADDLRRFLDNQPIRARPPSLAQWARKWARRHPTIVVSTVVLCVLTALGSLFSAGMIGQAYDREKLAHDREQHRAEQAEEGLKLARQSADELIQISEQDLAHMPFTEDVRKRMLTSALVYYQGLIAQFADDPNAQAELAATQEHVNKILADLAVLQGGARVDLLNRDDVKADLHLTAEQHARLNDLHDALERQRREGFAAFAQLTPDERQQRSLDDARAKEEALDTILTPQQQQRLRQIALQLKGLSAFHDLDVDAALKLTAEEKQRLRGVEADASLPGPRRGPGKPPEPGTPSPTDKFLAVLTDEQRRQWKGLTGEPFHEAPRPPGPDQHGPPGHGQPPGPQPGPPPG